MSPQRELSREDSYPERHEHERESAGGDGVEAELELGEDRHGEGLILEDFERPVLREQPERHEQAAPEHRGPDLAQGDAPEGLPGTEAEASRRLLEARVCFRKSGSDGEVDEGIEGEGHHHDRRQIAMQGWLDGYPAETD